MATSLITAAVTDKTINVETHDAKIGRESIAEIHEVNKDGQYVGRLESYYTDSRVRRRVASFENNLIKSSTRYNADGIMVDSFIYDDGVLAEHALYDDQGVLSSVRTFHEGVLISCEKYVNGGLLKSKFTLDISAGKRTTLSYYNDGSLENMTIHIDGVIKIKKVYTSTTMLVTKYIDGIPADLYKTHREAIITS